MGKEPAGVKPRNSAVLPRPALAPFTELSRHRHKDAGLGS